MGLQAGRLRGACASRKVRTPQGRVLGNAQAGKPDGRAQQREDRRCGHWPQVRVKRCGKSAPAVPVTVPARQAPPGATPDRDDDAARRVPGRRQRAVRQRAAQMDSRPRQNPAYRPATESPAPAGAFSMLGFAARTRGAGACAGMRRGDARDALEEAAEGCGVLVADRVADRVDGLGGPLEAAFCLLDPDVLDVGDRRVPGRRARSRRLNVRSGKPGALDQLGHGCGDGVVVAQPFLRLERRSRRRDRPAGRTARTAPGRRCATAAAGTSRAPAPRSGRRGARRGRGRGRARRRTRPTSRAPRARRSRPGPRRAAADVGEVVPERGRVGGVDRDAAARREPRLGDQEHAGAGGADERSLARARAAASDQLRVAAAHPDAVGDQQRGNDRDVGAAGIGDRPVHRAARSRSPSAAGRAVRRRARRRTAASAGTASSNVPEQREATRACRTCR